MTPATQIKDYRAKSNLSQAQFARLIGATQGLVSHWENARQPPGPEMAVAIERATAGAIKRSDLRPDLYA